MLGIIILILGLYFGLSFFKEHKIANNIGWTDKISGTTKDEKINSGIKYADSLISELGNGTGGTTSNTNLNGQLIYIGNKACSSCRDLIDIDEKSWDFVKNNPILYNFWENYGPIENYTRDFKSNYYWNWKTQQKKEQILSLPKNFENDKITKSQVATGYMESGYNVYDKVGLSGNNPSGSIIKELLYKAEQESSTTPWHKNDKKVSTESLINGYIVPVSLNDSYSYDKNSFDYQNLQNEFSTDSKFSVPTNLSDVQYPFLGFIHNVQYQIKDGAGTKYTYNGNTLFYITRRINKKQLKDFIRYIFSIKNPGSVKTINNQFWNNLKQ